MNKRLLIFIPMIFSLVAPTITSATPAEAMNLYAATPEGTAGEVPISDVNGTPVDSLELEGVEGIANVNPTIDNPEATALILPFIMSGPRSILNMGCHSTKLLSLLKEILNKVMRWVQHMIIGMRLPTILLG
jgi:hypothetical protein